LPHKAAWVEALRCQEDVSTYMALSRLPERRPHEAGTGKVSSVA